MTCPAMPPMYRAHNEINLMAEVRESRASRDSESFLLSACNCSPTFAVEASPKAPGASLLASSSPNQKETSVRDGAGKQQTEGGERAEDGRTQFFPFPQELK